MIPRKALVKRRVARSTKSSLPAPVLGLNTRDSLDGMDPRYAFELENMIPEDGKMVMRNGFTSHATGVGTGAIETIAEFHAGATRKLLAAGDDKLYDATSTGAATSLASGFANARWQWVNFNGSMGLVNGADAPQTYDGSTVSAMTISGSGLTVANIIGINVYKSRTYFWEDDSQDFWYSAVNALGGTTTKFPLSRVGQFGGNLTAMGTWTIDGGSGVDDFAVFVMSSGECIVYSGSDPGSDFALVGVYNIGSPVSIRGIKKVGGDIMIATNEDPVLLSQVLREGRVQTQQSTIAPSWLSDTKAHSAKYGWDILLYPKAGWVILNVPTSTTKFHQYVLRTANGAWTKLTGWNAPTFGLYNNDLYFGNGGVLYKADSGTSDNTANITCFGRQAWTDFKYPGKKKITLIRPLVSAEGDLDLNLGMGYDFKAPTTTQNVSTVATGSPWDTSPWDTSSWSPAVEIRSKWYSSKGTGFVASLKLSITTKGQNVNWYSTDFMVQPGTRI